MYFTAFARYTAQRKVNNTYMTHQNAETTWFPQEQLVLIRALAWYSLMGMYHAHIHALAYQPIVITYSKLMVTIHQSPNWIPSAVNHQPFPSQNSQESTQVNSIHVDMDIKYWSGCQSHHLIDTWTWNKLLQYAFNYNTTILKQTIASKIKM